MRRPVAEHVLAFLFEHKGVRFRLCDIYNSLHKQNLKHCLESIFDNLQILIKERIVVKEGEYYSVSPQYDVKPYTLSLNLKPLPKFNPPLLQHDHCDKCGRKFKRGDKFYIHAFSNLKVVVCEDCLEPKRHDVAPIAPCLFVPA